MIIVLDTTELFADLRLAGPDFHLLAAYLEKHEARLIVPQIVAEETANHFKKALQDRLRSANDSIRSLSRLIHDLPKVNLTIEPDKEQERYTVFLKNRLNELRAEITAYSSVSLSAIVERALARKKPFDSDGKIGFRDAIIWETVLHVLAAGSENLILVTRNKKDFGEHGSLTSDLQNDLESRGIPVDRVTICEGLTRFSEEHIKPGLETLDQIRQQIQDGSYGEFDPEDFFADMDFFDDLRKFVRNMNLEAQTYGSHSHYRCQTLEKVGSSPNSIDVVDVWSINAEISVAIDYKVNGVIRCEREELIGPYGEPDYRDYLGDIEFTIKMSVILDKESGNDKSWEISEIEGKLFGEWTYPGYDE